jgi:signal-transduction protein with cAMP-binding, CBS, and nucleotidyltransferase domain
LEEVVRILCDTDIHAIIVMESENEVKGIISHFDLIGYYEEDLTKHKAREVMSSPVIDISPEAPVIEAAKLMLEKDVHRLLVSEMTPSGKRPVGVISTTDIIKDMRGPRWIWYMG